jgi:Tol biopolymer transport system component
MVGNVLTTIVNNSIGAVGGINFSVDGKKFIFCQDVSNYQDSTYRQLDTRIFLYEFTTSTLTDLSDLSKKTLGTNDLDPRFSPNNAEIIFTNTSNDGISTKNIQKISLDLSLQNLQRTTLFTNAEMPDWQ